MTDGFAQRVVESTQIQYNQQDTAEDDAQIQAQFLVFEHIADLTQQEQIITTEVNAEKRHKHGGHILQIGGVTGQGIVSNTEATGAGSTESSTNRIKQRHLTYQQENHIQHSQADIDQIKDGCGFTHFGHQFAHTGAGAFCPQQMHGKTLALLTGEGQQEHQHTHTTQPVAETAPVEQSFGQCLHVGENRGTGGGESGDDLEEGIDKQRDFPGNIKGEASYQTEHDPTDTDAHKALFGIEGAGRIAAQ